jgi:hypothetical protein
MSAVTSPAWDRFIALLGRELRVVQVLVRRVEAGFDLRHESDRAASADALRSLPVEELRSLAQSTATGAFRPLKSAPNLPSGWRVEAPSSAVLHDAIDQLYPGAVADWFAAQSPAPPITHYREFTERQTGMYRITTMLNDEQAGRMIAACCDARFCLKRRLWTVAGLEPDSAGAKSLIPCLEPCAILLEFARKAMRLEQEEKATTELSVGEMESAVAALEAVLRRPESAEREADFGAPANSRRVQLTLDKLKVRLAGFKRPES